MVTPIYLNSPYSAAAQAMYAPRQMAAPQAQQMGYSQDASSEPTELEQQLQAQQAYAQQNLQQGLNPLQRFWNNLPSWAQWTVGIAGTALTVWGGSKAIKHLPSVPGKIQNFFRVAPLGSQDLKNKQIALEQASARREASERAHAASAKTLEAHDQMFGQAHQDWEHLDGWARLPFIWRLHPDKDFREGRIQAYEKRKSAETIYNQAFDKHDQNRKTLLSHVIEEHELRLQHIQTEIEILQNKLPEIRKRELELKDQTQKDRTGLTAELVERRLAALLKDSAMTEAHLQSARRNVWPPEENYPFKSEAAEVEEIFIRDTQLRPRQQGFFSWLLGHDWTAYPVEPVKKLATA